MFFLKKSQSEILRHQSLYPMCISIMRQKQSLLSQIVKDELYCQTFQPMKKFYFQLLGYQLLEFELSEFLNDSFEIYLDLKTQNLEEVILSVARSESNANEIAEKVSVIKAEDLYLTAPTSSAEVLELSPGVRIQKSQGGGGSPVIRGFEANRVLIVVDGVRMNNAIYRSGHLQNSITIDPNNIDRVEIIYGSSSVGYGSDALGGVVHYYTKTPSLKDSIKIKSSFSSNFNTVNSSLSIAFQLIIARKIGGFLAQYQYQSLEYRNG